MRNLSKSLVCIALVLSAAPAGAVTKTELWVYTSMYKEYAAPFKDAFEAKNPEANVQIFQAGSEKIQAKLEAELLAQRPQADILLTSDPFWSEGLEERGLAAKRPGHPAIETNYYSVMVLVAHKDVPQAQRPKTFADLTRPEFKNLVQMGSPLESGTFFSTVAYLSRKLGWDYFQKLKANNIGCSGGNSTVIQKVESGEKKFGMVLLENALAARKRGSPIEIIYPSDGGIAIPSVQVILKNSPHQELAGKFADFVLSKEGQQLVHAGYMHSVRKDVPSPENSQDLKKIAKNLPEWTPAYLKETAAHAKEIKNKFSEIVLE